MLTQIELNDALIFWYNKRICWSPNLQIWERGWSPNLQIWEHSTPGSNTSKSEDLDSIKPVSKSEDLDSKRLVYEDLDSNRLVYNDDRRA